MAEESIGGHAYISTPIHRTSRWGQLIACIICMVLIANLQYGWTLFVGPMAAKHGWSIKGIQVAFTLFIVLETWGTPFAGAAADKFGAKLIVALGGLLVAAGWILNSYASSLESLYLAAIVGGAGGGMVYASCIGLAVKWFPDRRGLATGLTAAGYGAGSALSVIPIRAVIASSGYEAAFFWFGLGQGLIVFLVAWSLRPPRREETAQMPRPKVQQSRHSRSPKEVLFTPVFWVLYVMFVLIAASGLMATAQIAPIAKDFGVGNSLVLWGITALSLALIFDNICNGGARPLFGWISDHIGRERTMVIAFSLGAFAYWMLGTFGHTPWAFVLFAALIFLTWGEIYSLFPTTCTDLFGPEFATVNLSMLYTAKGTAAFVVPLANIIKSQTGSWHAVFVIAAVMNLTAVAIGYFVLKKAGAALKAQ